MKKTKKLLLSILFLSFAAFGQSPSVTNALSLEEFLKEFRTINPQYQSLEQRIKAAELNQSRANLFTPTDFFARTNYIIDEKLPSIPFFNYGSLTTFNNAVGIENTTNFGLKSRLSYEVDYFNYRDLVLDPTAGGQTIDLFDARPVISLEQPLWRNGFGRKIKLQVKETTVLTNADKLAFERSKEELEIQAEQIYFQLVAAQEYLKIQQQALDQTKGIQQYIGNRVRMNLMDRSDLLQAQAQMELEELEVRSSEKNIHILQSDFNVFRGAAPGSPLPTLDHLEEKVDAESLKALQGVSLNYLSSKNTTELEKIQSSMAYDETLPVLDLFSAFALNGRDNDFAGVVGDSLSSDRTTFSIGMELRIPLDIKTNSKRRQAANINIDAAKKTQAHIQKRDAADKEILFQKALEAAQRLSLSKTIADTQRKKLELERNRLRQGRTTTYQVLVFERDLLLSDIRAVQAKLDWAVLKAELKKYKHTEGIES